MSFIGLDARQGYRGAITRCPLQLLVPWEKCAEKACSRTLSVPIFFLPFLGSGPWGNRRGQSPVCRIQGESVHPVVCMSVYMSPPPRLAHASQYHPEEKVESRLCRSTWLSLFVDLSELKLSLVGPLGSDWQKARFSRMRSKGHKMFDIRSMWIFEVIDNRLVLILWEWKASAVEFE